jgi:hypothetical protein
MGNSENTRSSDLVPIQVNFPIHILAPITELLLLLVFLIFVW